APLPIQASPRTGPDASPAPALPLDHRLRHLIEPAELPVQISIAFDLDTAPAKPLELRPSERCVAQCRSVAALSRHRRLDDLVGPAHRLAALDLVDVLHAFDHLAPHRVLVVEEGRIV